MPPAAAGSADCARLDAGSRDAPRSRPGDARPAAGRRRHHHARSNWTRRWPKGSQKGLRLGEVLVEMGMVQEDAILPFIENHSACRPCGCATA